MRAILGFVGGYMAGLAAGRFVSVIAAPGAGTDPRTRVQAGAAALLDAPRQVQARLQLAVEEGQRAAAETRADLEATAGLRPPRSPSI